uniref:Catalase n=1 Tax=Mycobacterium tuberculosis TaxID=1773 RepID=Q50476_MYCTX|nr:catalase [Mycobacterium tuberculosis]
MPEQHPPITDRSR